jgi:hypothetical protein
MVKTFHFASSTEKQEIIEYLINGKIPEKQKRSNFVRKCQHFKVLGDLLFLKKDDLNLEVLAEDQNEKINEILLKYHGLGHSGIQKLWGEIKDRFIGISRKRVEKFVGECEACALHLPLKEFDEVRNVTASKIFEHLQIDLIDVRKYADKNDGFSWILNCIDVYSRFSFVFPLKTKTAKEVIFFSSSN